MGNEDRLITLKDLLKIKEEIIAEVKKYVKIDDGDKWIKTKELRKILDLSGGTLQYLRNNNKITFSRVGRTIYYLKSDVDKMFNEYSNRNDERI